jgi:hypothetical protein
MVRAGRRAWVGVGGWWCRSTAAVEETLGCQRGRTPGGASGRRRLAVATQGGGRGGGACEP